MQTEVLRPAAAHTLPHAADVLRHGGLVAFPTDTVYGVGASTRHSAAIRRLYAVKGRPTDKAIAILLASDAELEQVTLNPGPASRRLAATFWPGSLTLVLPRHPDLPAAISSLPSVGVRIPDHRVALELLRLAGPLAATSANRSGASNSLNAADVLDALGGRINAIVDGGTVPGGLPSTVVDCTIDPPAVLRAGPITEDQIRAVLAVA